jgi:hypothetical protein
VDKNELLNRTRQFAVKVFKLIETLPKTDATKVVAYQLLESMSKETEEFITIFTGSLKTLTGQNLKSTV